MGLSAKDKKQIEQERRDLHARDQEDQKINAANRKVLRAAGLKIYVPDREMVIDTGETAGVNNVVAKITAVAEKTRYRLITIEGLSGAGKTDAAKTLAKKLRALRFSLGELFRYVSWCNLKKGEKDFGRLFRRLTYHVINGQICLFDGKENITQGKAADLRSPAVEENVPRTSRLTQKEAIALVAKQVNLLKKQTSDRIVLEGRAFTLDFIPTDLRVKLTAADEVRARRRYKQRQRK